jgi:hypothetical protein
VYQKDTISGLLDKSLLKLSPDFTFRSEKISTLSNFLKIMWIFKTGTAIADMGPGQT